MVDNKHNSQEHEMDATPYLWTYRRLSDNLDRTIHEIRAATKYLGIKPVCMADRTAVFDNDVVTLLRHEFNRIDAIRSAQAMKLSIGDKSS